MAYQDSSLTPYHGSEPYIFISYSHRNADRASAIIRSLNRAGYRVWYDEGLIPGREWDENIARIIMGCGYFIALITREYLASSNCKDELNYARDKNKPILLIYLDEVALPAGMELRLGRLFAVHYNQYSTTEEFYLKVFSADGLARCNRRSMPPVSGTASNAYSRTSSSASRSSSAGASGRTVSNERTREAPAKPRAKAEPASSGSGLKVFGALLILALLIGIGFLALSFFIASFLREGSSAMLMNCMFALAGIGWATINVNSFPMVVELSRGGDVGKYTGFYYTASMAAQTFTPYFSGALMDKVGMTALFPYATVFVVLAAFTMAFVKHGDSKPIPAKSKLEALDVGD